MTMGADGCYNYIGGLITDGALNLCDDSSRFTFQVLATEDVMYAKGSVNARVYGDAMVTTHVLSVHFNGNLIQTQFDGYFYLVGNTPVTVVQTLQTSFEASWMALVDYFPPGVPPQIEDGELQNHGESRSGYITFTARQGSLISALSLMVDMRNVRGGLYSPVQPAEGGFIVPRLNYVQKPGSVSRRPHQETAYTWGLEKNWTIAGYSMGSPKALSLFHTNDDVTIAEMELATDTELTINTPCHAGIVYVDLQRHHVCPTLTTTTTNTTTSTFTTITPTSFTTSNASTTVTTTTTASYKVTTAVTAGYDWPPLSDASGVFATAMSVIRGSLVMEVPNAEYFMMDIIAQDAVAAGIATAIGVPSRYVSITISRVRRLAASRARLRRLAETVRIDYVVKIPHSADTVRRTAAVDRALAITPAELTMFINAQAQAVKGSSFTVNVVSKTTPTIENIIESPDGLQTPVVKVKASTSAAVRSAHSSVATEFAVLSTLILALVAN